MTACGRNTLSTTWRATRCTAGCTWVAPVCSGGCTASAATTAIASPRCTSGTSKAATGPVEPAYLAGEAGILAAWLAVAPSAEPADRLERVIRSNAANETNELLWGAPGTMVAAVAMFRRTGEPRWAEAYSESAEELWRRWLPGEDGIDLWTQELYGSTRRFVGAGHGFAVNVPSLHMGGDLLQPGTAAELDRRAVATTTALAEREAGCANWPPLAGQPLEVAGTIRVQWCHGAPGMVTSLAGIAPDDGGFSELLAAGGELTWQSLDYI